MKNNISQRRVNIIAEVHPQHHGSLKELERMILQCKLGGADYVKVQLYSSKNLFNNLDREYLEISKEEYRYLCNYCKSIGIGIFASVFDEERLNWSLEEQNEIIKIASRTVSDKKLCKKIISTKKKILVSLGMYDFVKKNKVPFIEKNVEYLYCVSKYPASLTEILMPDFEESYFSGYSDHTIGISACVYAVSRGAKFIEKHYSNNKSLGNNTQMAHVCSMDFNDLVKLREISDSITLIRSKKNK